MSILDIQGQIMMLSNKNEVGNISDGSHTFNELYYHRMVLFSMLCNMHKQVSWKSKLHHDGTMYPNYFIVGIDTPEGQYSYHYEMTHWDMFDVVELQNAPMWDGHKPDDILRLTSLMKKPCLNEWVNKELEIACGDEDCGYVRAVYNSAVKAYMSLSEDSHSGLSIGCTKNILNRLIDGLPLTQLTGDDSEWSDVREEREDGTIVYQNNRCSAVFKYVHNDGTIKYSYLDQFTCVNVDTNMPFHAGHIYRRVEPLFPPITMPFYPTTKPIKIFVEEFLYNEDNGDFDTVGILYYEDIDGKEVDLNIYLAESDNNFVEITREQYMHRKNNKIK